MISNRQHLSPSMVLSTLAALAILMSFNLMVRVQEASAAGARRGKPVPTQEPSPVGAWWGRAIPNCQGQGRPDCPPEVVMMPMIHPPTDPAIPTGLVTVTDSGLVPAHSTGLGIWFVRVKDNGGCPIGTVPFEATFGWLQGVTQSNPNNCSYQGSVRTRFITCFDADNPDQMTGTLTPFFYNHVDLNTCASVASEEVPVVLPDLKPWPDPLPETCNGTPEPDERGIVCPFTANFTINRVTE